MKPIKRKLEEATLSVAFANAQSLCTANELLREILAVFRKSIERSGPVIETNTDAAKTASPNKKKGN